MNQDGNSAVFVGTDLVSGDAVQLCPPCVVEWAIGIAEGGTGLPVSALIEQARRELDAMPDVASSDSETDDRPYTLDDDDTEDDANDEDSESADQ